ncbi:hypothetical protein F5050DRAFT_1771211 [Lentinula boryana]|uniref:Zn(2)-C6 fungal-type domain-containing protein n=1 Tax=Lentinula boryana TaxID=40481 RepID=A0ABQ8Q8T1_9AGAR|nr:hypothetical protein F5050DRAFT_1771211 [Lentinula boryana]
MAKPSPSPWVSDYERNLALAEESALKAAEELVKKKRATELRKKLAEERRKEEEEERRRKEEEMRRTHEEAKQYWSDAQARWREREEWEARQRAREAKQKKIEAERHRLRERMTFIESWVNESLTTHAGAMEVRNETQSSQITNKRKRGPESIASPNPGDGVDHQGLKNKAPCDRCVASRRVVECVLRTDTTKAKSCVPCHRMKQSCSYNADRAKTTRKADSECGRYQMVNEKLLVMDRQVKETICLAKKMGEEIREVSRVIRGG